MLGKKCKSMANLPSCCVPNSDCVCLGNRSQVASETVHARKLAAAAVPSSLERCSVCLEEEEKVCKCDNNISTEEELFKSSSVIDHAATPRVNANSSFAHSVINMVGMLIGLGQLSTPYALQNGGWSSAFLLIGLGIVCAYSCYLLGKCLSNNPKLMNYTDIGHHAFGTKGRLLAASFIYMEIFMALVSYTISLHDNLNTVFFGAHFDLPSIHLSTSQLLTVIAILVALPSLWLKDLSSISFLSTGGIFMSLVIFTTVALTPILGGVKANREIQILRVENIPAISGLYIFSFAGHIVFPNIHKEMKDPSKFTKELVMCHYRSDVKYALLFCWSTEAQECLFVEA